MDVSKTAVIDAYDRLVTTTKRRSSIASLVVNGDAPVEVMPPTEESAEFSKPTKAASLIGAVLAIEEPIQQV